MGYHCQIISKADHSVIPFDSRFSTEYDPIDRVDRTFKAQSTYALAESIGDMAMRHYSKETHFVRVIDENGCEMCSCCGNIVDLACGLDCVNQKYGTSYIE